MTCLFVVVCPACPACHWGPSHLALWSAEFSSVLHFARLLGVRVFCLRLFAAGWCFCLVWFSPVGLGLVRFLGFLGLFVSLVWLRWFLLLWLRRLLLQPFVSALSTWGQLTSQSSHTTTICHKCILYASTGMHLTHAFCKVVLFKAVFNVFGPNKAWLWVGSQDAKGEF